MKVKILFHFIVVCSEVITITFIRNIANGSFVVYKIAVYFEYRVRFESMKNFFIIAVSISELEMYTLLLL